MESKGEKDRQTDRKRNSTESVAHQTYIHKARGVVRAAYHGSSECVATGRYRGHGGASPRGVDTQHRTTMIQSEATARAPRVDISFPAVLAQASLVACAALRSLQCYAVDRDLPTDTAADALHLRNLGDLKHMQRDEIKIYPVRLSETPIQLTPPCFDPLKAQLLWHYLILRSATISRANGRVCALVEPSLEAATSL